MNSVNLVVSLIKGTYNGFIKGLNGWLELLLNLLAHFRYLTRY